MTTHATSIEDESRPLFTVRLSPYRSLSLRGFNILMSIIGIASFLIGLAFWRMGAWPVFGFFGLDALLIYLAFRRNYRDARAFEEINLSRERLLVRQVSALGRATEYDFNPYWTRLIIDRRDWGIAQMSLASSNRRLAIGRFLAPNERASFADALSRALAMARSNAAPA